MRGMSGGVKALREWLPPLIMLIIAIAVLVKMGALKL
jgi:hypothetical protein